VKIAYIVHFRGGTETGIFHKVARQSDTWSRSGHEVGLFVTTDPASAADWKSLPQAVSVSGGSSGARSLLLGRERLAQRVLRWRPDVVYARHTLVYPGLLRVARRFPLVIEINSDDVAEFRGVSPRRYRFARMTRGLLLGRAAGLVFVTRELAANPCFTRFRKPGVVIANGIPLDQVEALPPADNALPRLIFLGHPHTPWHGLDQLELLASGFPEWQFEVVGPDGTELSRTHTNVRTHGVMTPAEFAPLMAEADVAIGSLGLYRNHMNEASPIKVREYLAYGLPVIVGCRDTDFPDGAPFMLTVPNRPGGVTERLPAIEAFVSSWIGRRVPRGLVAGIDSAAKERQRLAFIERLASS
jgi:hypothetical protein